MIHLSGAIRIATEQELMREGEVYAQRGWTLKDPTTHNVSITVNEDDIEDLAAYLRQRPRDKRSRAWTDRRGIQHEARTVTLYLKGTEMAGNWIRLRAAIDPQAPQPVSQASATGERQRPAPPVRRAATPQAAPAPAQSPAAALEPVDPSLAWACTPDRPPVYTADGDDDDDELPF